MDTWKAAAPLLWKLDRFLVFNEKTDPAVEVFEHMELTRDCRPAPVAVDTITLCVACDET